MSLLTNRIGDFDFIALKGRILPPAEMLESDQRPGVDGTEFTQTGVRGEPFQLISQVDSGGSGSGYQTAVQLYDSYLELISSDPVEIIQGGVSTLERGFRCQVLRVRLASEPRKVSVSVGGLNGGNGWLECLWDLQAVAEGT